MAAERLGYHRYWVAEHHNMPGIASSAPAVLLAHLASVTATIRLGSGGVMLPNHAPLVIAEQFGMLEALHPGPDRPRHRPGARHRPAHGRRAAPRRSAVCASPTCPSLLGELLGFFNGTFPDDHPYRRITAVPALGYQPAIWLLGSSDYSARLAGLLGLPFSFAHHFAAGNTDAALAVYRDVVPAVGGARRAVRDAGRRRALRRDRRAGPVAGEAGRPVVPAPAGRPARPLPHARGGGGVPPHAGGEGGDQGVVVVADRRRPRRRCATSWTRSSPAPAPTS